MAITLDGTNGITSPDFEPSSSTTPTNGLFLPTTNALGFATNSTERLRLDASGNLGIGTTSPSGKLAVYGPNVATNSNGLINVTSTDAAAIDLGGSIGFGGSYTGTSTTPWATISGRKENATDGNYASYLQFATRYQGGGITERARIDSSGNLLVGVTSATSGGGVIQVSDGITFPATQSASSNANTLDDYEEGSWTPTANGAITLNGAYGWYVKVGKVVHVCAQWAYPTNSNTSSALVNGLPFTSNSASSNYAGSVPITSYGSDNLYIFVGAGTAQVFVRNNTNTDLTNANLSNKFVQFMASYII